MKSTGSFEEMIETIRTFFLRADFDPELVQLQLLGQDLATTKGLLSQDYQPLPPRFLDCILHDLCYLDWYDDGTGEEWAEVVLQALKRGANIHNYDEDTWWRTSVRSLAFKEMFGREIGRETPLDTFLSRSREGDATTWLQVLDKFGINLQEYAKEEQELHDFNHRVFQACEGGCGIPKVKYSIQNQLRAGWRYDSDRCWTGRQPSRTLSIPPSFTITISFAWLTSSKDMGSSTDIWRTSLTMTMNLRN
jgi:hypothetical protein